MKATHVIHGIRVSGRKSKFSAWFRADPILGIHSSLTLLIDCERIDALGRSYPCNETEKDILRTGGYWYKSISTFNTGKDK